MRWYTQGWRHLILGLFNVIEYICVLFNDDVLSGSYGRALNDRIISE